mgnify:CR=1 FL=1
MAKAALTPRYLTSDPVQINSATGSRRGTTRLQQKGTVSGPDRAAPAPWRFTTLLRAGRNNGLVIGRASRALVNPQGANANGEWTGCKGHWLSIPRVSVSPQYSPHGPRNDAARRPRVTEVWGVVPRNSAWSGRAGRSSSSRAG